MKKATFGARLRYRFDNFMSRGTVALVGALFAVTFLVILAATLILVVARLGPEGSTEPLSLAEAFLAGYHAHDRHRDGGRRHRMVIPVR